MKMFKIYFSFFLICFALHSKAQINLVPNPSFEDTIGCPLTLSALYQVANWLSFSDSPDYYNSCSISVGVPDNPLGSQNAADGNAYVGCIICSPLAFLNSREFFGIQLQQPLLIGQRYFVSFKTVLSDPRGQHNCACNNLGAKFSTFYFHGLEGSQALIDNAPQIFTSTIIDDSLQWTVIKGSFIADSAYEYVSIGNFFDDQHTDTIHCPTGGAYYYFDQICVSIDSNICNSLNEVENISFELINIYPNPADEYCFIKNIKLRDVSILIYNSIGEMVIEKNNVSIDSSYKISLSNLPSGIYEVMIFSNDYERLTKKLIINHEY